MNAWVCFRCPAHGLGEVGRVDHGFANPIHAVRLVDAADSHRWRTIHGLHPRLVKKNACQDAAHLALCKEAE